MSAPTSEQNEGETAETHIVENQPPPLEGFNAFECDLTLREGLLREGGGWAEARAHAFGGRVGAADMIALARDANRYPPELRTHDRFGHRIDEVAFHPAWHALLGAGVAAEVHSLSWREARPGAHVARAVLSYLMGQAENGVSCPLAMTFAGLPVLRLDPELAAEWEPKLLSPRYDRTLRPVSEKAGALMGMAMTEKQGGSDVRANTTQARALGRAGPGGEYALTGHKWFCSAPMSDAFLTLAYSEGGLSCFFVPRFRPDGTRNVFRLQRLKDKLGNRSNASAEIEYAGTWARMVGEEGRGVATIIDMVNHTRLECAIGSASIMRQAVAQAIHHAIHRTAFQRKLADQPVMARVLADLALEAEAATALSLRLARAFDEAASDGKARAFARIVTAIAKYWISKRTPALVYEAMECLGGNGYVEESVLPRLYREAPVNAIWEGSGNVICLDVLRALDRDPQSLEAVRAELDASRGADRRYDAALARLDEDLRERAGLEARAREIVGRTARLIQAALLLRHAPPEVADFFIESRIEAPDLALFGSLRYGDEAAPGKIIRRAWPAAA